tara:strand:+ start:217 stop:390 length:174 start_codon:yes stop_codon:yes gene_type:complete
MNRDLVTAVANKVSDKDSVILFDILKKTRTEDWWNLHEDTLYQLCLKMLEDMESEEE